MIDKEDILRTEDEQQVPHRPDTAKRPAEIQARLMDADGSRITAPSVEGRHIYSPWAARNDIAYLLNLIAEQTAEIERLRSTLEVSMENARWFADKCESLEAGND